MEKEFIFGRSVMKKLLEICESLGYKLYCEEIEQYDSAYESYLGTNKEIKVVPNGKQQCYGIRLTKEIIDSGKFVVHGIQDEAYAYTDTNGDVEIYIPENYKFFTKIKLSELVGFGGESMSLKDANVLKSIIYQLFVEFKDTNKVFIKDFFETQFENYIKNPKVFFTKNADEKTNKLELELYGILKINPISDFLSGKGLSYLEMENEWTEVVGRLGSFLKAKPDEIKKTWVKEILFLYEKNILGKDRISGKITPVLGSNVRFAKDMVYNLMLEVFDNKVKVIDKILKEFDVQGFQKEKKTFLVEENAFIYKKLNFNVIDLKENYLAKWWSDSDLVDIFDDFLTQFKRAILKESDFALKDLKIEKNSYNFTLLVGIPSNDNSFDLNKLNDLFNDVMQKVGVINKKNIKVSDVLKNIDVDKIIKHWMLKSQIEIEIENKSTTKRIKV